MGQVFVKDYPYSSCKVTGTRLEVSKRSVRCLTGGQSQPVAKVIKYSLASWNSCGPSRGRLTHLQFITTPKQPTLDTTSRSIEIDCSRSFTGLPLSPAHDHFLDTGLSRKEHHLISLFTLLLTIWDPPASIPPPPDLDQHLPWTFLYNAHEFGRDLSILLRGFLSS